MTNDERGGRDEQPAEAGAGRKTAVARAAGNLCAHICYKNHGVGGILVGLKYLGPLKRRLAAGAPTCTLWRWSDYLFGWTFRGRLVIPRMWGCL